MQVKNVYWMYASTWQQELAAQLAAETDSKK